MKLCRRVSRFSRTMLAAILELSLIFGLSACQTEPVTGRKQFILLSHESELELGAQAYKEALANAPISKDPQVNEMVKRVGMRIAEASKADWEKSGYQWEFTVIDDPKTVNAWALPGGKVAVYTGILPVTKDETGLAVVLGHEIGHATARHGAERITQQLIIQGGETALALGLQNRDPAVTKTVLGAFGIGATIGASLPFSRKQESKADEIGLIYMARAGYDPQGAIDFWNRMTEAGKASPKPLPFLSDHPPDEQRVADLEKELPAAKAEYQKSRSQQNVAPSSSSAPGIPASK